MAVIIFCGVAGKFVIQLWQHGTYCNIILSLISFTGVTLLSDYKRLLVNGLNLSQPSFIYAYLALLVQSGNIEFETYDFYCGM